MSSETFDSASSRSTGYWLCANLVLAIIIYLNAALGAQMGIHSPSLQISVIWPATGFALAALLLFGKEFWIGILFGNFCYNLTTLFKHNYTVYAALSLALLIALCSLLQALWANDIIKRYGSKEPFSKFKDVVIFLLPAGLFACLMSSTLGSSILYLYDGISQGHFGYTWLTFFLGDLMGVYIFTPALYVWVHKKMPDYGWKQIREIPFMILSFACVWLVTFIYNYPLIHLFIPLCIWVTYRFLMHGATFAVLCVSLSTLIATSQNFGPFLTVPRADSLLLMVSFLEIVVVTCLILAAIFTEREARKAWVEKQHALLKKELLLHKDEIQDIHQEMFMKEASAALGGLYFEITKQLIPAIKEISAPIQQATQISDKIAKHLQHPSSVDLSFLTTEVDILQGCFKKIDMTKHRVERLTGLIEEQMFHTQKELKSVNLHTLLNQCLEKIVEDFHLRFPSFKFSINKKYDREVTTILALPWELSFAFVHLIYRALYSMKEGWNIAQGSYYPTLEIQTLVHQEHFEIVLRGFDALGQAPFEMQSFFDTRTLPNIAAIGLTLAYDIIVKVHHGVIHTDTKESVVSLHILLPKSGQTRKTV